MIELESLTLGNRETYEKGLPRLWLARRNKSGLVAGKTSSDNPALLTNFVTGHLLQGYILTTIWRKHKRKIQWYHVLGTNVVLYDFTLSFPQQRVLARSFYAICDQSILPFSFLLFVWYPFPPWLSVLLIFPHDHSTLFSRSFSSNTFQDFPALLIYFPKCQIFSTVQKLYSK